VIKLFDAKNIAKVMLFVLARPGGYNNSSLISASTFLLGL